MSNSINSKQTRTRTTLEHDEYYQQKFLSLFQNTYSELQVKSVQDAIMQLKLMNWNQKRRFNWIHFDQLIGRKSYDKKSFSYKYVNEVLYKKYFGKTSYELRVVIKRSTDFAKFKVAQEFNQNTPIEDTNKEEVRTKVQNQIEKIQCLTKNDALIVGETLSISDEINIFAPNPNEFSCLEQDFQIRFSYFEEE
ncbi:Hypothetical_protein [Hexamita inflata]|uniref:Hypothetical_protein n=1 Tax=Hexamita inflata TaxID=28002 RepID=A0AA86QFX0_9EUKA|nr:Hypothetical protein HINF_LOCUS38620 [Hexamita inflata]